MATMTQSIYRQPLFSGGDDLFRRCLTGASIAGAIFLIVVLLVPARQPTILHVEQLPERFARLIIEKPQPHPAPAAPETRAAKAEAPEAAKPEAQPAPRPAVTPRPRRLEAARERAPDTGAQGRQRAQEATASVQKATQSIDRTLAGLSSALQSTPSSSGRPSRRRRARTVRAGRSGGQIGDVEATVAGGRADLGGSVVEGSQIAIGSLSAAPAGGGASGAAGAEGGTGASGSAPGVYRSTASLLAVVQKYAAGIQYCYGNELKHDPSLSGKLVVAITVSASGRVTDAAVVQNTLKSPALAACALSQIREWRFPTIAEGVTTFQAPFVFTPPR